MVVSDLPKTFLLFASVPLVLLDARADPELGVRPLNIVADTKFSIDRGWFTEALQVVITSATPGATIVYTLDSSTPSPTNGTVAAPGSAASVAVEETTILRALAFKEGMSPTNVDTHTYIFPRDLEQPVAPGKISERIPYQMDFGKGDDSLDPESLRKTLLMVPIVSLVFDPKDLFGPEGIYLNAEESGELWERAASLEWFEPGKKSNFQVDCGGRIQGAASRKQSWKKGFRLNFTKEFGPGKLEGGLFEETNVEEFDSVVLRNPTHDSWCVSMDDRRNQARYVNDSWCVATQLAMGRLSPHRRWVHLYLNGYYWGAYILTERPDEDFMASYFGGGKDDYDVLNANRLRHGSRERFDALVELAGSKAIVGRRAYEELRRMIDIDAFIDYFLYNVYACNTDWPDKNYWVAGKRSDDPLFRFFNWDAEIAFSEHGADSGEVTNRSALDFDLLNSPRMMRDAHGAGYFYRCLKRNPEFCLRFADRLHLHTAKGGALSPAVASSRYRALLDEVEPLLVLEAARWGNLFYGSSYGTRTPEWKSLTGEGSWLFSTFFPKRSQRLVEMFRDDGVYPSLPAPELLTKAEASELSEVTISIPNPARRIYYTLDGTDPRENWTGRARGVIYTNPLKITPGTPVMARARRGSEWSALSVLK